MECPYCKAENRDGVRYCSNCGRYIGNPASSPGNPPSSPGNTGGSTTVRTVNSRALTVGTPLQGGRYVIKKVLGEGGMGAALLASDNRLDNKQVVIKELLSDNNDPARFKEDERNFKQEVITLAHLDHPLIPNVTDNFEEGGRYFMVQEYVDGENLEERMDRLNQPMKERDVLIYASQILDVLEYLAEQTPPIVHRDIKPANIIISSKDKRAHLVDFGIARADVNRNARRKQTSALGTPGYAPPEQYQGNADPRSDLYALGATLHHLLTNRDPRNYPPFNYPPVRTLNPQVSAETERVIAKAVNNDITQRYQSATAMRRDIDDILMKRYGVSGDLSSFTLKTSGPIAAAGAAGAAGAASAPTVVNPVGGRGNVSPAANQPTQVKPAPLTPIPPVIGSQGSYGAYQPPPRRRSNVGLNFFLFILVIALLGALAFGAVYYFQHKGGTASTPTPTLPSNGIGLINVPDGEHVGISDGSVAFDTSRPDGTLKAQAAQKMQQHDTQGAIALWQQAIATDPNDAETLIYLEDQTVVTSGTPYITIVVATMSSGSNVTVGRDDLQGAYVAQKEYNDGVKLGGTLVRLLIANSGNQADYATLVAQQIVKAAQADSTIIGVMGWPFSSRALPAQAILAAAHIPMVSQTASTDLLTGKPYFFRVAPPNTAQGKAGATYVEQKLHAKSAIVFLDPHDSYSSSLGQDFIQAFKADGNTVLATENYTVGKPATLVPALNDALTHTNPAPDVIYFSGYASDASVLLTDLPTTGQFATLPVMGGDALYELGGYQSSARAAGFRLHFTTFAYPDEWTVLGYHNQQPPFFTEYPNDFDPDHNHTQNPYGYDRPDGDVILSYDATVALLKAAGNLLSSGKKPTPALMNTALLAINGANSFQGASGQISFGSDGNPIDKAFVILHVSPQGFIQMESTIIGTFLKQ
ncbi:MAG TPA: protein kinase [Ktedonobacteraceae bacterium]|nr:protein kinase [Ktedonobacteraceae bacterium]